MKNLWIIPTDKAPIKGDLLLRHLWKGTPLECISWWRYNETTTLGDTVVYSTLNGSFVDTPSSFKTHHIYITNSEEIKQGVDQWYLDKFLNKPHNSGGAQYSSKQDVIIMTTDQDLIKDGVQAIDGVMASDFSFLDWIIKNPNCEEIEIKKYMLCDYCGQENCDNLKCRGYEDSLCYEIIIPKEEAKQDFYKIGDFDKNCDDGCKYHCTKGNTQLAECLKEPKQERMYSEEDMKLAWKEGNKNATECMANGRDKKCHCTNEVHCQHKRLIEFEEWFEQFKKK